MIAYRRFCLLLAAILATVGCGDDQGGDIILTPEIEGVDYAVVDITVVQEPTLTGTDAVIQVTVRNRGTRGGFSVPLKALWFDADDSAALPSKTVPALAPSDAVQIEFRFDPAADVGFYTFSVQVDPSDLNGDADLSNNVLQDEFFLSASKPNAAN